MNLKDINLDKFEKWSRIILYELLNIKGGQLSLFERKPSSIGELDLSLFEILEESNNKLVDTYYIYIEPEKLNQNELSIFIYNFRKYYCNREKSNIYIIDNKDIYPLIKKYPLDGKEYLRVADHFVAISTFDAPKVTVEYPYKDSNYKKFGGNKVPKTS